MHPRADLWRPLVDSEPLARRACHTRGGNTSLIADQGTGTPSEETWASPASHMHREHMLLPVAMTFLLQSPFPGLYVSSMIHS